VNNETLFAGQTVTNNIDVVNNIASGCLRGFAVWDNQGQNLPMNDLLVTHNTFVNAVSNTSRAATTVYFANNVYSNFRFENNIIYQGKVDSTHNVGNGDSDINYSNNLWFPSRPSNSSGSSDIVGKDPLFADSRAYQLPQNWSGAPSRDWFKVKGASPAVNAGKVSTAFNPTTNTKVDMFLVNRDSSPDIGVHEYGGSPPPSTPTPTIPPTITPTPFPTVVPGPNLVNNHSFESSATFWTTPAAGVNFSILSGDATDGINSAQIEVVDSTQTIQLFQQDLPLDPDTSYTLSFDAKSSTGNDINVQVRRNTFPYTNYGLNQVPDLTNTWQSFTYQFTTSGFVVATTDTRLQFKMDGYDTNGDIYKIDNVVLARTTASQPPCPLTGDTVPCDDVVNIQDYIRLSNSFGGSNSDVDLSPDGIINILDYMVLSNNFGNSI